MKRLITAIYILGTVTCLQAQNTAAGRVEYLIKTGNPGKALRLLEKDRIRLGDEEAALEMIPLLLQLGRYERAGSLARDLGLPTDSRPERAELYARILLHAGVFRDCVVFGNNFLDNHGPDPGIETLMNRCQTLEDARKAWPSYVLDEFPFNSSANEYAPIGYRRHLVYLSDKRSRSGAGGFQLLANARTDGKAQPALLLKDQDGETGPVSASFTADGNEVYYSAPTEPSGKEGITRHRIYHAHSLGNVWARPAALPFTDSLANYRDPALHPDGDLLVFASDAHGRGDFDLYFSIRGENGWSKAQNLGPAVNSEYDERSPVFDRGGDLYFSSERPGGFGGSDFYRTRPVPGGWSAPDILPAPLNSPFNDVGLLFSHATGGGFFASDRAGGKGGYDIYKFSARDYRIGIAVVDAGQGGVIDGAIVTLLRYGAVESRDTTGTDGLAEFAVRFADGYRFAVVRPGYLDGSVEYTAAPVYGQVPYVNLRLHRDTGHEAPANPVETTPGGSLTIGNTAETPGPYIMVTLYFTRADGVPAAGLPLMLVNDSEEKTRLETADEAGVVSLKLYPGNRYRFVAELASGIFERAFSTEGLAPGRPLKLSYELPK